MTMIGSTTIVDLAIVNDTLRASAPRRNIRFNTRGRWRFLHGSGATDAFHTPMEVRTTYVETAGLASGKLLEKKR
jgi:hypothetical protein